MKRIASLISLLLLLSLLLTGCGAEPEPETPQDTAFVPALDTTKEVTLNVSSFFGNFEALTEVMNDFNEFYPNVTLVHQCIANTENADFLKNNSNIDIFMTSNEKGYSTDICLDLIAAGVDVADIDEQIVTGNKWNGTLYTLPIAIYQTGLVVNKTLLAKEGLQVPETWGEFLTVLETLKEKGYTPLQGPNAAVATLTYSMVMSMLANDSALLQAVKSGDEAGSAPLKKALERITALMENGYTDTEVNKGYPANNYEGAILKFFEGDVPFWACDTEKVSGMKKRETKSEAFKASPFEYEFMYAPLGDNGAYKYIEPWYGFAVNKDSAVKDYAVEFMRFLARRDELNTLASVKGVPSIAKVTEDTRYANLNKTKAETATARSQDVETVYGKSFATILAEYLGGEYETADAAWQAFLADRRG